MAQPIVNLLCGLWSCIKGSLRLILFFGCLIFVVTQLVSVLSLMAFESISSVINNSLMGHKIGFSNYLLEFYLLFIALLGAYGSFYKHHKCLRLFAILVAITSIFSTLNLSFKLMNNQLDKEHDIFIDRMKNYSIHYDWTEGSQHGDSDLQATMSWDLLQTLKCCGLDGPDDWAKWRPKGVSSNDYPTSCCPRTARQEHCHKVGIFKEGCLSRVLEFEAIALMLSIFYIAFQFFLCIIAYILLLPEGSDAVSTSSRRGVLPQEYQRFEGSVYVRQPAEVPQQFAPQQPPIQKNSNPPMYPNVQNIEKRDPSSPPPSYY